MEVTIPVCTRKNLDKLKINNVLRTHQELRSQGKRPGEKNKFGEKSKFREKQLTYANLEQKPP